MWIRLLMQPWWVRTIAATAILSACVFVGAAILWFRGDGLDLPVVGTLLIVLGCLVVGGLAGAVVGHHRDLYMAALEVTSTPAERSEAIGSVWRGPIPENPRAREAAGRLTWIHLALHDKNRSAILVLYPLLAALWLFLAVTAGVHHEPGRALWNAIVAGVWVYALVWTLLTERRLRNRVAKINPTWDRIQANSSQ
jgi:Flp pilus assembly protein TadB